MTGNISDIDYISGSYDDREGGITIFLHDGVKIEASCIEFNLDNNTFETS